TSRGDYWVARFRGLRPLAGNDTAGERATKHRVRSAVARMDPARDAGEIRETACLRKGRPAFRCAPCGLPGINKLSLHSRSPPATSPRLRGEVDVRAQRRTSVRGAKQALRLAVTAPPPLHLRRTHRPAQWRRGRLED